MSRGKEAQGARPAESRPSPGVGIQHLSSPQWARQDSNLQPTGYEPAALPLSYGPAARNGGIDHAFPGKKRATGFEPATFCLEGRRSTPELRPHSVGAVGFEPTTPTSQTWCANLAAPRPDAIYTPFRACDKRWNDSAPQTLRINYNISAGPHHQPVQAPERSAARRLSRSSSPPRKSTNRYPTPRSVRM